MKNIYTKLLLSLLLLGTMHGSLLAASDDFERGRKAYLAKNYTLARQYIRRALSSNPSNATYRYYLAQILVQTNQLDKAQTEYQRIIQTAPYSKEARYAKIALVQIRDYINNQLNPKWRPINSNLDIGTSETTSKADVGDNYIDKVTEKGQVMRWQKSSMPLKVYLETNPKKIKNFNNEFIPAVKKGIESWADATKGAISFTYVSTPETANIKITWKGFLDPKLVGSKEGVAYTAGYATPEYRDDELFAMSIVLSTSNPNGVPHEPEDLKRVTMHEVGHALGIMGHSTKEGDIMYANSQNNGDLSDRDINTMILLYELEPDISNFIDTGNMEIASDAKNSKDNKESDKNIDILGTKEERLQNEIDQILEELKKNPKSDINHVNLGNLYGDSGDYEKAIKEYEHATRLNPKNDIAFSNLGVMYQNVNKPYDALRVYNKAKKLNPDKPKPYIQIAIISEQLNQKADAIMNLKKYLELNPKGASDPEVQNLLKKLDLKIEEISM